MDIQAYATVGRGARL